MFAVNPPPFPVTVISQLGYIEVPLSSITEKDEAFDGGLFGSTLVEFSFPFNKYFASVGQVDVDVTVKITEPGPLPPVGVTRSLDPPPSVEMLIPEPLATVEVAISVLFAEFGSPALDAVAVFVITCPPVTPLFTVPFKVNVFVSPAAIVPTVQTPVPLT